MRLRWTVTLVALTATAGSSTAIAQDASASGALGAGMFDARAAATVDVGVDAAGQHYAMGFGARLRWVDSMGFRAEEWDALSEWVRILRYLNYRREDAEIRATLAVGELGGVTVDRGTLVDGYSSGLDIDHRHLGMQLRVENSRYGAEAVVDDLVAPRLAALRTHWQSPAPLSTIELGATLAADFAAPESGVAMAETTVVPLLSVSGRYQRRDPKHDLVGGLYTELAVISTLAAGVHLGLEGAGFSRRLGGTRFAVMGEIRLGTDSYLPGWIGPLYEIDRYQLHTSIGGAASQLEVARAGGLAGLAHKVSFTATTPRLGQGRLSYIGRSGVADLLVAHVTVPYFHAVQGGISTAAEVGEDADTWVVAAELRARISRRYYASIEAARLYRRETAALAATWIASASFGARMGL